MIPLDSTSDLHWRLLDQCQLKAVLKLDQQVLVDPYFYKGLQDSRDSEAHSTYKNSAIQSSVLLCRVGQKHNLPHVHQIAPTRRIISLFPIEARMSQLPLTQREKVVQNRYRMNLCQEQDVVRVEDATSSLMKNRRTTKQCKFFNPQTAQVMTKKKVLR